jgi:hypothetical protein
MRAAVYPQHCFVLSQSARASLTCHAFLEACMGKRLPTKCDENSKRTSNSCRSLPAFQRDLKLRASGLHPHPSLTTCTNILYLDLQAPAGRMAMEHSVAWSRPSVLAWRAPWQTSTRMGSGVRFGNGRGSSHLLVRSRLASPLATRRYYIYMVSRSRRSAEMIWYDGFIRFIFCRIGSDSVCIERTRNEIIRMKTREE